MWWLGSCWVVGLLGGGQLLGGHHAGHVGHVQGGGDIGHAGLHWLGGERLHRLHGGGSYVRLGQNLTRVVGGGGYTTLASTLYLTKRDRLTIGVVAWDCHVRVL